MRVQQLTDKKFNFHPILLGLLAVLSSGAHAEEYGHQPWYVGVDAGYMKLSDACESHVLDCDDDTIGYGVKGGYLLDSLWGFELGYHDFQDLEARYPAGEVSSDIKTIEALVTYRQPLAQQLYGFVNGGAAYSTTRMEGALSDSKESNWSPTVGAGLEYRFTEHFGALAEYRYVNDVVDSGLHYLSLGLNYYFGGNTSTPVVQPLPVSEPEPVLEPEPVVKVKPLSVIKPEPRTEVLYFDTASVESSIDSELIMELQGAEGAIFVVGHTDSVGSSSANKSLSYKRAKSVAEHLVRFGIDQRRVMIQGRGEERPIANNQTAAGRAKNRRVEVQYEYLPPQLTAEQE
ncbi:TPA: OmpA family protein [Vibrio parahaemolyticus]